MKRREFLQSSLAVPFAGAVPIAKSSDLENNVYTRLLGVRPHIGAHEHISRLSGSRMPDEVMEALVEANRYFVDVEELSEAAGRKIAELLGAEAALVTAGGFSSMILAAAGCLTGTDPAKIDALPHPDWPKRECLIQKAHRFSYDRAYRAAGMTIVEAHDRDELVLDNLGENTAMIPVLAAVEEQRQFGPPVPKKRALPARTARADARRPHRHREEGRRCPCWWTWRRTSRRRETSHDGFAPAPTSSW